MAAAIGNGGDGEGEGEGEGERSRRADETRSRGDSAPFLPRMFSIGDIGRCCNSRSSSPAVKGRGEPFNGGGICCAPCAGSRLSAVSGETINGDMVIPGRTEVGDGLWRTDGTSAARGLGEGEGDSVGREGGEEIRTD